MGKIDLVDSFGRTISYLRISVTDRCNLRCRYCMPSSGVELIPNSEILRYEELLKIINCFVLLGLRRVRFTGGEPLVREDFVPFLKKVKETFPSVRVSLTTNGILLKNFCKDLLNVNLDSLNVSLDTLDPSKYQYITRFGDIRDVWSGIEIFLENSFKVKLNVVTIRGFNDDEIMEFVNITKHTNLVVRFIEFMPVSSSIWKKENFISIDEIKEIIEKKYSLEKFDFESGSGPAKYFKLPWGGVIGFIGSISHHFCGSCNRIRLTADGRIKTCLFGGPEVDLKKAIREGSDEENILLLIKRAIELKPRGWFDLKDRKLGPMSKIGG
ncbi:MAG: GTP 3',8-cyclase MoaA [Synergistetes bacterium]|nr:GTP 3',8-cyclase MoaA [Synergistota bacterium]MCX8128211.1 GTP 3',8-cyclase MoaA [Synergistota bacterium]MDW8192658.1 GTP 3',8-cyclase MoaA [Synergistota bacterium]